MALRIRDRKLYSADGSFLKEIDCPARIDADDLEENNRDTTLLCSKCSHTVFDTDFMSEDDLAELLQHQPDACLKINLMNSMFQYDCPDCKPELTS